MPAAAPAASSVFLSAAVVWSNCPSSDPSAPPVAMMGDRRPRRRQSPAGADGDGGRDGLEQRDARGDAALVEQHLLHRLGDAVAADGGGAVARHQADDDRAPNRDEHHQPSELVAGRRDEHGGEAAVERDVGDQRDEPGEELRDDASGQRDHHRETADEHHPPVHQRALGRHPRLLDLRHSPQRCDQSRAAASKVAIKSAGAKLPSAAAPVEFQVRLG